jgi:hypothetical protein
MEGFGRTVMAVISKDGIPDLAGEIIFRHS